MNILKRILSLTAVLALLSVTLLGSTTQTNAAIGDKLCEGIGIVTGEGGTTAGDCTTTDPDGSSTISNTINSLINLFSLVVGAVSVIMIIYGGFKYMTSQGSDDGTKNAKNTILYALVGLVIVLLSQTIVKFVFSKALDIDSTTP